MPRDWLDPVDMEFAFFSLVYNYPDAATYGKRGGAECGTMDKGGSVSTNKRVVAVVCYKNIMRRTCSESVEGRKKQEQQNMLGEESGWRGVGEGKEKSQRKGGKSCPADTSNYR